MSIQALCFDADGVLLRPQERFWDYLTRVYGVTMDQSHDFFSGDFNDCLVDKASLEKVLPPFLEKWNWPYSTEEFIRQWLHYSHTLDAQLIELIKSYRLEGLPCYLATNQERRRALHMKTELGLERFFDRCFFSCEMGVRKPDAAYYQYIQNALGLDSRDILFWDDQPVNVEGARACGWNAEVYKNAEECKVKIKEYKKLI